MPEVEKKKLSNMERIVSPEEWEALNDLFDDLTRRDIAYQFGFDTGRYSMNNSFQVIQGPEGWFLEVGNESFSVDGERKLYRSIRELVKEGWTLLGMIAPVDYLEGHVEFED